MLIKEIMSTQVLYVEENTPVLQAAQYMAQHHTGSVLVMRTGMPIGIVTERDLTYNVVAKGLSAQTPVKQIMTSPIYHCQPAADITEVANTMTTQNIKKMPVMEGQRVIGIVTQTDVIKNIYNMLRQLETRFRTGKITQQEYADQTSNVFKLKPSIHNEAKEWHMRCLQCHTPFMNTENNGELVKKQCPKCHSPNIDFDRTPHT